jgi:hypothetical protein
MPVAGAGEAGFHSWAADGLSGAILALSDCTTPSVRCNGKARMDASLLIGAPIGLGILLAFGIVMVAMAYLAQ